MTKTVEERYQDAKARYAEIGVDTEAALKKLQDLKNLDALLARR